MNIEQEIELGYVSENWHPKLPIRILNYTARCQWDWRWNETTMACRGLILGPHGDIVQRPFKKFFNYDQEPFWPPEGPIEVFEKLDGSLGVLYSSHDGPAVATRGSFTSSQAIRATAILRSKYPDLAVPGGETWLVEILFPENRIVVNYDGLEELVLIAIIDKDTGKDKPLRDVGLPIVKKYEGFESLQSVLDSPEIPNREGYVVKFSDGRRTKIKFADYVRLHKLMTNMSDKDVWECLRTGQALPLENIPDEFYSWLSSTRGKLLSDYESIVAEARQEYEKCIQTGWTSRRTLAERVLAGKHAPIVFKMIDGKDYSSAVWKLLRPSGSRWLSS